MTTHPTFFFKNHKYGYMPTQDAYSGDIEHDDNILDTYPGEI